MNIKFEPITINDLADMLNEYREYYGDCKLRTIGRSSNNNYVFIEEGEELCNELFSIPCFKGIADKANNK